jgi:hypothetical protein
MPNDAAITAAIMSALFFMVRRVVTGDEIPVFFEQITRPHPVLMPKGRVPSESHYL